MDLYALFRGVVGLLLIIGIAWLFSNNKKSINWRLVAGGLILQIIFAILIIKGEQLSTYFAPLGWFKKGFEGLSNIFVLILDFTSAGSNFVFGALSIGPGAPGSMGVFFAFQVLPSIIFFASLVSILYYLGVMQKIVKGMAWVMSRIMGTSGAESISCAAEVFVGQTEAPLMIKPYIKGMTQSELFTIMVGGMATIAGGVLAAYIQMLASSYAVTMNIPLREAQLLFATHLLGASVMAAPAALLVSKIMFPEVGEPETKGTVKIKVEKNASNIIEAAANGASDGLQLTINVAGMLIAFIALIAMLNYGLESFGYFIGVNESLIQNFGKPLNFQLIFGLIFQFIAYGIGIPSQDAISFGSLIGTKITLNEFVAYADMQKMIAAKQLVDPKSILMATYALCGFANFSSIAIQIGGTGALAPSRKADIAKLGLKAVVAGSLATLMTATLAGILF